MIRKGHLNSWPFILLTVILLAFILAGLFRSTTEANHTNDQAPVPAQARPAESDEQAATLPEASLANSPGWHQLGGNAQRTHYVDATLPTNTSGNQLNTTWRVLWVWNGANGDSGPAAGHLHLPDSAAPILGDGRLYIGHNDGAVRAINTANGSVAWTRNLGGSIFNTGAYDALTGAVFFGSTNGNLYKLRASDGAILDNFNAGAAIEGAVLLVNDSVYVGTMGGNLYRINTTTMQQTWVYNAGAGIAASPAYSASNNGLIIVPAEDQAVHAIRVATGARAWRTPVTAFSRPPRNLTSSHPRPARYFPDTYPVVAEAANVVIIRSYYNWDNTWAFNAGAPVNQNETRQYLQNNPSHQSLFVLNLSDGTNRFDLPAPVFGGAIGNGNYYYSSPPQAVVKRLGDGTDVAYLIWRNRSACRVSSCDGREDSTIGEMNLATGVIRFVDDHKNQGTIRLPTDEQGTLSMVGDVLFHSHWMSMGAIRITNRTTGGGSFSDPIPSVEYLSVSNTIGAGQCASRDSARRFCPEGHTPGGGEGYQLDRGFYLYYSSQNVYDQYWTPSARGPAFDNGVLYWKSVDGAIIALAPVGTEPVTPTPTGSPIPTNTTAPPTPTNTTAPPTPTNTTAPPAPTNTTAPPTSTGTVSPTPTASNTSVPPTATNTSVPPTPTATNTSAPTSTGTITPTSTSSPTPTGTRTAQPTVTPTPTSQRNIVWIPFAAR
ncbi:PQQ-binding-like beta-propeller repeat protein [Candidatus Chloroploca asiatica]|uniref:Pyrrolo-quinoline quinone repeat domain-containing protein n=1 Tax=Candidatus Chloroploca asiatica TaxID=1506545 RepID=A0A2H3KZY8_9CHLR|nr:PQQ-binding-like beta-propeller repeat protein [Candidatus Chloroploca asiatica]PDV96447.1 hypothetical protein A9Q02_07060 [Candidatus Chloroploca asiatica]